MHEPGRERENLTQAAKMALAAVLAWGLTLAFPSPQSFMAPYAAVFLMSETAYRSLVDAARQIVALLLGLLLAYTVGTLVPVPVLALALAVFVGALLGQWHRFAGSGIWIAVTALLMLVYGTADQGHYLLERMAESLVGAAVGVAVNSLVLPPVHLRSARRAVEALAGEIRLLLSSMAEDLLEEPYPGSAWSWPSRARTLERAVRRAEEAMSWGRESTRFNVRWRLRRRGRDPLPSTLENTMGSLRSVSDQVQRIAEALVALGRSEDRHTPEFVKGFAGLLEAFAACVSRFEAVEHGRPSNVGERLDVARARHRELQSVEFRQPADGEERFARNAALLAAAEALRVLGDDPITVVSGDGRPNGRYPSPRATGPTRRARAGVRSRSRRHGGGGV